LLTTLPFVGTSQTRLILNDNVYINIVNGANLVIENSNADAINTAGTGGNIISEGETNVVKWLIGSTNSLYTVPFSTASPGLVKIPLVVDKTSAGTGAGYFEFSTWNTNPMNSAWPSAVTNMNLPSTIDGSLGVADRFWHIDASSYSAKPDVTLSINYEDNVEIASPNTITESNLQAQRFNTNLGHWETYMLMGTNDAANDRVTNIVASAADFYEDWILVDNTNPLPVTLTNFEVNCNIEKVDIVWATQSEINNDYFVVEKSYDGQEFFELETISGAGNSNSPINYTATDNNTNTLVYYRLKQVDFDGTTSYSTIKTTNCLTEGNPVLNAYFSPRSPETPGPPNNPHVLPSSPI
jgi:hypothetical protein